MEGAASPGNAEVQRASTGGPAARLDFLEAGLGQGGVLQRQVDGAAALQVQTHIVDLPVRHGGQLQRGAAAAATVITGSFT